VNRADLRSPPDTGVCGASLGIDLHRQKIGKGYVAVA
jgi:hypothetical protein